jgi:hypothetical protein
MPARVEARVQRRLGRFERAVDRCAVRACDAPDEPRALLGSFRDALSAAEARLCAGTRLSEGDPVDPDALQGPVGLAPLAVDPATAASLDELAEHCLYEGPFVIPPLIALPVAELPDWCSEDAAYLTMVAVCGRPRVMVVAAGAALADATGSPEHPYPTIADALTACGRDACHVLVAPGTYVEPDPLQQPPDVPPELAMLHSLVPGCVFVEGGVALADGVLTRGAARPHIDGRFITARRPVGPITLARLEVTHPINALDSDGDVLVSDAVLVGGSTGATSAWDATGPRVCGSHVAGGNGGLDLSWDSTRLWIAGSAIEGCYSGAGLSWGSRDLKVLDSVVYGHHEAIGVSWGATDVVVRGSRLGARMEAVSILVAPDDGARLPRTFDVEITGNRIHSGRLPASDADLNIVIENNVREKTPER